MTNKKDISSQKKNIEKIADIIGYAFMLFREAYPKDFYFAYPAEEARTRARGVWKEALKKTPANRIKKTVHYLIKNNRSMPSLGEFIYRCKKITIQDLGLKEPLQAYYEACNMPNANLGSPWSHPVIYYAAKNTGWYFLKTETQRQAFPIFEYNYKVLCERILDDEDISTSVANALSNETQYQKSKEQAKDKQLQTMLEQNIDPESGRGAFEKILKEI